MQRKLYISFQQGKKKSSSSYILNGTYVISQVSFQTVKGMFIMPNKVTIAFIKVVLMADHWTILKPQLFKNTERSTDILKSLRQILFILNEIFF